MGWSEVRPPDPTMNAFPYFHSECPYFQITPTLFKVLVNRPVGVVHSFIARVCILGHRASQGKNPSLGTERPR